MQGEQEEEAEEGAAVAAATPIKAGAEEILGVAMPQQLWEASTPTITQD